MRRHKTLFEYLDEARHDAGFFVTEACEALGIHKTAHLVSLEIDRIRSKMGLETLGDSLLPHSGQCLALLLPATSNRAEQHGSCHWTIQSDAAPP